LFSPRFSRQLMQPLRHASIFHVAAVGFAAALLRRRLPSALSRLIRLPLATIRRAAAHAIKVYRHQL